MNKLVRLFNRFCASTIKMLGCGALVAALAACGGGDTTTGQGGGLLGSPDSPTDPVQPTPTPGSTPIASPIATVIPTPAVTPTPDPSPIATPTPNVTPGPSPSPSPTVAPTPTPIVLSKPDISVTITSQGLRVVWGQSNGIYRILYAVDDQEPLEMMAAGPSSTLPIDTFGNYMVIVEAYDHVGNSIFSDPAFIQVGQ